MREGWTYKTLGQISQVITKGTTPTTIGYNFTDNGINFIKIECIDANRKLIKDKLNFISEECNNSMIRSQLQEKDLLFSIAGALGRIYIVEKSVLPANTNQALAIIRLSDKQDLFLLYLSYFLNSNTIKRQIEKDKVGVAQINLSLGQIKNFIIPIPSIAEQERIVSELDLLSGIIEKKKEQLKEYDKLAQSIFYDMFGDPVENKKGWEQQPFYSICKSLFAGGDVPKDNFSKTKTEKYNVPIISNGINDKAIYGYTNIAKVEEDSLTISGRGTIGYCAIRKEPFFPVIRLIVATPKQDIILPIVLKYIIDSLNLKGEGVAIPQLTIPKVKNELIILPPLSLQQSFAEKVEAIEKQKTLIQQSITETETLFNSRMNYYFN